MAIESHPRRIVLTYEDYLELPNDRNRYEILDGELEVNPAPATPHQRTVFNLGILLHGHVLPRRLGEVFIAPYDVLLADTTIVQPDIVFVSTERFAIVLPAHIRGAPDLLIEVISPTSARADRLTKAQLYARYGVPFYWLLDPLARTITAFALQDGVYRQVASAEGDGSFSAPPFPDLVIPLGEVWGPGF